MFKFHKIKSIFFECYNEVASNVFVKKQELQRPITMAFLYMTFDYTMFLLKCDRRERYCIKLLRAIRSVLSDEEFRVIFCDCADTLNKIARLEIQPKGEWLVVRNNVFLNDMGEYGDLSVLMVFVKNMFLYYGDLIKGSSHIDWQYDSLFFKSFIELFDNIANYIIKLKNVIAN